MYSDGYNFLLRRHCTIGQYRYSSPSLSIAAVESLVLVIWYKKAIQLHVTLLYRV